MEDSSKVKHTVVSPQSVVLTYYEGDINAVVDEHFFRALNKNSLPKDLSIKPQHRPSLFRPVSEALAPSSPSWSSVPFPPNHPNRLGQSRSFPGEGTIRPPSVIVSRPEPSPASWSFPTQYTTPSLPPQHPQHHPAASTLHNLNSAVPMTESRPNFYWH